MPYFRLLVLLGLLSSSLFALAEDKTRHIQACMLIGYTGETILHTQTDKPRFATVLYASGISFLVGLTKEVYDQNDYGGFSSKDLAADAIGAFSGALLSHYLNKHYFLRVDLDPKTKRSSITGTYRF